MAMITPEGTNDTHMGFNTFHMTKKLCTSDSYTCKGLVWWLGNLICCCHSNIMCVQIPCFYCQCTDNSLMLVWLQLEVLVVPVWSPCTVTTSGSNYCHFPHSTQDNHIMLITLCLQVSIGPGQLLTLVFSSSGSLSEHQPGQWLQNLQFHSIQDCGREYSRISASSENQFPSSYAS